MHNPSVSVQSRHCRRFTFSTKQLDSRDKQHARPLTHLSIQYPTCAMTATHSMAAWRTPFFWSTSAGAAVAHSAGRSKFDLGYVSNAAVRMSTVSWRTRGLLCRMLSDRMSMTTTGDVDCISRIASCITARRTIMFGSSIRGTRNVATWRTWDLAVWLSAFSITRPITSSVTTITWRVTWTGVSLTKLYSFTKQNRKAIWLPIFNVSL